MVSLEVDYKPGFALRGRLFISCVYCLEVMADLQDLCMDEPGETQKSCPPPMSSLWKGDS